MSHHSVRRISIVKRLLFILILPSLALFALWALAGSQEALARNLDGNKQPVKLATVDVSIANFSFQPQVITVTAGSAVRWTNNENSLIVHTTTSDPGSTDPWDSGDLAPGASFSKTFNIPGTYPYHCMHHPEMTGMIVVIASTVAPSSVRISGPSDGVSNTSYLFTATVSPLSATEPITFVWQATGQSPITHVEDRLTDTLAYTWTPGITGVQMITVTATNAAGSATGTHIIILDALKLYLPLVAKAS